MPTWDMMFMQEKGDRMLRVLHTPGHPPGHVAYLDEANQMLFTGDTAHQGPVYACFEGSDPAAPAESVKRLAALPDVRTICPGHDEIITEQGWLGQLAACVEAASRAGFQAGPVTALSSGRNIASIPCPFGCRSEADRDPDRSITP